ncbi:processive 1,2-diacylglycerol beta-glucosyltransferase [Paenibacillus sp. yr247]|uniref:MGDG synthase family glycosyltransferase n=1 Tax=Paenibacillus sp. yr247 TaxID=1761880 RepID=UPI00088889DC|nr:glycosyltransferase [Paenibacillus sp. yr247]SDN68431.1 processive 1,2-diacylglycerol beta-glucosyltransferase [Paenibacillus sp. yr247]
MTQLPRILLLTASYGAGHLLASYAIKEHCLRNGLANVQIIDLMKEAHPLLNKISTAVYMGSFHAARFGINYYGWSYYMTQKTSSHSSSVLAGLNRLGSKQLLKIISKEQPDAIINTFPYGAAPAVGRSLGIPTFTIITDYFMHARWLHPANNKYYVATDDLMRDMIASGVSENLIEVTGIPIRDAFEKHTYKNENKRKKMILLIAGSHSEHYLTAEMIRKLRALEECHIMVVCGRNTKLEQFLNSQFHSSSQITIFGFVEQINELMASASCIISKAGGLTLTESLALKIPIFIYRPFAGQEKDNATYFSKKGVAAVSYHMNELVNQIHHYVSNDAYASQVKSKMDILHRTKAADRIVKDVLRNILGYKERESTPYSL